MSTRIVTAYIIRPETRIPFHALDVDIAAKGDELGEENGTSESDCDELNGCYENQLNIENEEGPTRFLVDEPRDYFKAQHDGNGGDTVDDTILAVAAGADGIIVMRASGEQLDCFAPMDLISDCRVYGVKFLFVCGQRKLAVLALVLPSRKWFLRIYGFSDGKIQAHDVQYIECPITSSTSTTVLSATLAADVPRHDPNWRLRIATLRGVLFVLGCAQSCSAIWALALPNLKWRTILVEKNGGTAIRSPLLMRMRPPEAPRPTVIGANAQFPISSTAHSTAAAAAVKDAERAALPRILFKSRRNIWEAQKRNEQFRQKAVSISGVDDEDIINGNDAAALMPDTFTCFDVGEWRVMSDFRRTAFNAETRVLLCEGSKSRLNVLRLASNGRIESRVVKTKRSKELSWIVRGPKLAVWDEQKDVLVFDASGKLFFFCGSDYRIKKVIADFGKNDITALAARNGWCFAADATGRCIHTLRYKLDDFI